VRGSVEVVKGIAGAVQRRICVLEDGDFFGEIALLKTVPRTASVCTLVPCTFLSLQRDQFNYLLARASRYHARQKHRRRRSVRTAGGTRLKGDT
jgi:ATP-binding cassette, subfamily B, bacterial